MAKTVSTYVILMRAVNVGGKNKLPMRDLAAILAEAGCAEVQTYIQSGNAVVSATAECAKRLPQVVAQKIAKKFGFQAPVVMRSAEEIRQAVSANPFLKSGADPQTLHVMFLADLPEKSRVAGLDPKRSPGDFFEVRGREIYLRLPNGAGRSKLTNAYFDSKLATVSTSRNLRTVLTLLEMAQGRS